MKEFYYFSHPSTPQLPQRSQVHLQLSFQTLQHQDALICLRAVQLLQ